MIEVFRFIYRSHSTAPDLAEDAVMGNSFPTDWDGVDNGKDSKDD
jgi:hypothetical protein